MRYEEAVASLPQEMREALGRAAARAGFAEDDPLYGLLVAQVILLGSAAPLAQASEEAAKAFAQFSLQAGQLSTMQKEAITQSEGRIAALEAAVKKVGEVANNAERVSANALLFALLMAFALGISAGPLISRFCPWF